MRLGSRIAATVAPWWLSFAGLAVLLAVHAYADARVPLLQRTLLNTLPKLQAQANFSALAATPPQNEAELLDMLTRLMPALREFLGLVAQCLGVMVVATASGLVHRWLATRTGEALSHGLRAALFRQLQRLPLAHWAASKPGEFTAVFNNELIGAQNAVAQSLPDAIYNIFSVGLTAYNMYTLNPRIALLCLGAVPFFYLPTAFSASRLKKLRHESIDVKARLNDTLAEALSLQGIVLARTYRVEEVLYDDFSSRSSAMQDIMQRVSWQNSLFLGLIAVAVPAGSALLYAFGGLSLLGQVAMADAGTVVAFTQMFARLQSPVMALSHLHLDVSGAAVCFERLFRFLDLPTVPEPPQPAATLPDPARCRGELEADGVCFTHDPLSPRRAALTDVSVAFRPGRVHILCGSNGSGKTTLSLLLAGLQQPSTGVVRLDGVDLRALDKDVLYGNLVYLPQDPFLLHETLRANLLLARPLASDAECVRQLRAVGLGPLLDALPAGLDTVVGHRGFALSGGEQQRVALARALLRGARVMLLDEYNAHLDDSSAEATSGADDSIERLLVTLAATHTVVVVTHRPEPLLRLAPDAHVVRLAGGVRVEQRGKVFGL